MKQFIDFITAAVILLIYTLSNVLLKNSNCGGNSLPSLIYSSAARCMAVPYSVASLSVNLTSLVIRSDSYFLGQVSKSFSDEYDHAGVDVIFSLFAIFIGHAVVPLRIDW